MSFLSCGWLTVVHSQLGMSVIVLGVAAVEVLVVVAVDGVRDEQGLGGAVVAVVDRVPVVAGSRLVGDVAVELEQALVVDREGRLRARPGATYWSNSEHRNTAVQRSTRLFRAPVPSRTWNDPRDLMVSRPPLSLGRESGDTANDSLGYRDPPDLSSARSGRPPRRLRRGSPEPRSRPADGTVPGYRKVLGPSATEPDLTVTRGGHPPSGHGRFRCRLAPRVP